MLAESNRAIASTPTLPVSNAKATKSSAPKLSFINLVKVACIKASISSFWYPKALACFIYADIPFIP